MLLEILMRLLFLKPGTKRKIDALCNGLRQTKPRAMLRYQGTDRWTLTIYGEDGCYITDLYVKEVDGRMDSVEFEEWGRG